MRLSRWILGLSSLALFISMTPMMGAINQQPDLWPQIPNALYGDDVFAKLAKTPGYQNIILVDLGFLTLFFCWVVACGMQRKHFGLTVSLASLTALVDATEDLMILRRLGWAADQLTSSPSPILYVTALKFGLYITTLIWVFKLWHIDTR